MNGEQLLASFFLRLDEADLSARLVLDEFIRIAERLPDDAVAWRELAALDENWRDTLSDSQVIRNLRAMRRIYPARKDRRRRLA